MFSLIQWINELMNQSTTWPYLSAATNDMKAF